VGTALAAVATVIAAVMVIVASGPRPASAVPLWASEAIEGAPSGILPLPEQTYTAPEGAGEFRERDGFRVVVREPEPKRSPDENRPHATDVVRPVDGLVPVSGAFGPRHIAGCGACSTDHQGLDLAAAAGAPIGSAKAGIVTEAGPAGGYGLRVVVAHTDGLETRYAHMSAIAVSVGQRVVPGERLGSVGSTGVSTGPHLHFEVVLHGAPTDPGAWLRSFGVL
jgi:murein DD-endopeptidase MepM/ murein hydrolase activator NlpD